MVEFIIGAAGTGKTKICIDEIVKKLQENPLGSPLILLLPDHMTFAVEQQLAVATRKMGGFSRAHVLGLSRLAYQILNRTGGSLKAPLNDIGKQLILSRVLKRTPLKILAKAIKQHHFTSSMARLITEFKRSGISTKDLQKVHELIQDAYLQQKLEDIIQVYDGLNEEMAEIYQDSSDLIGEAILKVPNCDWLSNCEIWIDGFDAFNMEHLQLIQQLTKVATNLHITLCLPSLEIGAKGGEMGIFRRPYEMYMEVANIAHEQGIKVEVRELTANHRFTKPALAYIEEELFKFPIKPFAEGEGVKLVEVANRRLECEAVAADILRLCREENYRFQDIGVLLRDEDNYGEVLLAVLKDYDIPCFRDNKGQGAHHPLAELMRSTLEVVENWQYEAIFRSLKTGFFAGSREDIDTLENYVLEFGIKGRKRWLQEENWPLIPKDIAINAAPWTDEEDYLAYINNLRKDAMAPLGRLQEALVSSETIEEYTKAFYDFLVDLQVPEQLEILQKQAVEAGDLVLAKEHQQIWNNMMNLLEQLVQVCGSEAISMKDYAALVNDGLDSINIGLIPPGCDYATLAPFEHNTLNNKRGIYILGANEKVMPRQVKGEGLLTEKERLIIKELGLKLTEGPLEDNYGERYLLYKGFTLAREYLWVSYPLADEEGSGLGRSMLVDWLRKMLPNSEFKYISQDITAQDRDLQLPTARRALTNLTKVLNEFKYSGLLQSQWLDVYNYVIEKPELPVEKVLSGLFAKAPNSDISKSLAESLYTKNKVLRGSVTRFEQFINCPFKHFLTYGLGLNPRSEFTFAAPNLGIMLHEVLQRFGNRLAMEQRNWGDVTPEECQIQCRDIIKELVGEQRHEILLSSSRYKHLLERIERLSMVSLLRLIEFNRQSEFTPKELEGRFSSTDKLPALIFRTETDNTIEIIGQIDRLDTDDNYFLVIDYKSGKAGISLQDIFYGLKLQLLTYLLVAYNAMLELYGYKEAIPAAMMYCFLRRPNLVKKEHLEPEAIAELVRSELRMPGWFINDPEVIKRIDSTQEFIKISLKKDNTISSRNASVAKDPEEFHMLMDYIKQVLKNTGERILEGEGTIAPYRLDNTHACTYCPYTGVCRFDKYIQGYGYRDLEKLNQEAIMEKIQMKLKAGEEEA